MSQTIDNRVVEMSFDNKNFEKGVDQTLNSLDKLDKGLNKVDGKSFDKINAAASNVDLSKISAGVEALTQRFSTLGIAGMTVVNKLTSGLMNLVGKGISQVISGGMSRALNLEQASFMLHNTFKDAEDTEAKVKEVMAAVNDSVVGTRYGYDEAAKAASQLAASGIEVGNGMEEALAGMAGVATIANTDYESISNIFTAVAGQGKVMTQQLRMLELRGINAAAEIAKYMGKSEQEVRDLVTKGEIDFKTFSAAMAAAFGDSSKKANETFTGALANMKAALSRIGQGFMVPYINNMREVFVTLIPVFDGIKAALGPVYTIYEQVFGKGKDLLVGFLKTLVVIDEETGKFAGFNKRLQPIVDFLNTLVAYRKDEEGNNVFVAFTGPLGTLIRYFQGLFETFKGHTDTINGIKSLFQMLGIAVSKLLVGLKPLGDTFSIVFGAIINALLTVTDFIGRYITKVQEFTEKNFVFAQMAFYMQKGITAFNKALESVIGFIGRALKTLIEFVKNTGLVQTALGTLKHAFISLKDGIAGYAVKFDGIKNALSDFANFIKNIHFSKLTDQITGGVEKMGKIFAIAGDAIGNAIHRLLSVIKPGDFRPLIQLVNGGLIATLIFQMSKFFSTWTGFTRGLASKENGGVLGAIRHTFLQLKDTLFAFEKDLNAKALIKVAGAIAILAASLWLLASIDPARLIPATIAIEILMTSLRLITQDLMKSMKVSGSGFGQMSALGPMLLLMATSVLILAAAVKKISDLNLKELAIGITGVTALLVAMVGALKLLSLIDVPTKGMVKTGLGILLLSKGIEVLADAVYKLAELDDDKLIKGLSSVIALIAALSLYTLAAGDAKRMATTGLGILILAEALLVLQKAVLRFGVLDTDVLLKGLASVISLIATLGLYSLAAGNAKRMATTGLGILIMAEAILILQKAVESFGTMDTETLIKGLGSVIGLIITLGVYARLAGDSKRMLTTAASLIIVVKALEMLWGVVFLFGRMPLKQIGKGFAGVAAGLAIMVGALALLGKVKGSLKNSASLLIMAKALEEFSKAFKKVGSMSWSQIGRGLAALAGGLIEMAAAMALMKNGLSGAAAMFVMAEALKVFVPVIQTLGGMKVGEIVKGLVALAGAFLVIGAAAIVLGPVALPLLALAAAIALLGAAVALFGGGLLAFGMALDMFSHMASDTSLTITETLKFIADLIVEFIISLGERASEIGEAGTKLLLGLLEGISNNIGPITEAVANIIINFTKALSGKVGEMIDAGFGFIVSVIDGLASAIYSHSGDIMSAMNRLVGALGYFALEALKTITDIIDPTGWLSGKIEEWQDELVGEFDLDKAEEIGYDTVEASFRGTQAALNAAGFEGLGEKVPTAYATGISNETVEAFNASRDMAKTSGEGAKRDGGGHYAAGQYAGEGFISGLNSKLAAVRAKAAEMAGISAAAAKAKLLVNSPSKVFIGIGSSVGEGFIMGIDRMASAVARSSTNVADGAISAASSLTRRLASRMESADFQPTIRPVVDMSNIEASKDAISSAYGPLQLGASIDGINLTNARIEEANAASIARAADNQERLFTAIHNLTRQTEANALDMAMMYDAVREGASNAKFKIQLNNRELTRGLKDLGVAMR